MHPFTYGQTVTLIRRVVSGTDPEYGNDTYTETREDVALCVIAPASSSEVFQFTEQTSDSVMLYLPTGTDVSFLDAVLIDGDKYEVAGNSQTFISPFSGHVSPVVVRLSRVTGASV